MTKFQFYSPLAHVIHRLDLILLFKMALVILSAGICTLSHGAGGQHHVGQFSWLAKENCQCVPSSNILQDITYSIIRPKDSSEITVDFGKIVRAGYFVNNNLQGGDYNLPAGFVKFYELADLYNTQVDIILPYGNIIKESCGEECNSWDSISKILRFAQQYSDGITIDFRHDKSLKSLSKTLTRLRKTLESDEDNDNFKINLLLQKSVLSNIVANSEPSLLAGVVDSVDYMLVVKQVNPKAVMEEKEVSQQENSIYNGEELIKDLLALKIPPHIYNKIIPVLTNENDLNKEQWDNLTEWKLGYHFLGIGLDMDLSVLSDLSAIELKRDLTKMDDIKRLQYKLCPECCDLFCPHQEQIRIGLFAVVALLVFTLLLGQVFIKTSLFLSQNFIYVVILFVFLFVVFQSLMVCDPWFQDGRDFSALFSVILVVGYILFSSYKRKRQKHYP